jgi:hypothetical protein
LTLGRALLQILHDIDDNLSRRREVARAMHLHVGAELQA